MSQQENTPDNTPSVVDLTATDVNHIAQQLASLEQDAATSLGSVAVRSDLEMYRVAFLGKKGRLTTILRSMGTLSAEQRPLLGKRANEVRDHINAMIENAEQRLQKQELEIEMRQRLDVTLPGTRIQYGFRHPLSQIGDEIIDVLASLGFERAEFFEVEHDFYNFEALNMPKDHPARDMQDTFYIDGESVVLRTHTSPMQIRSMMTLKRPPIRLACLGRVYRKDEDQTHSPMFHQIEGLYVDENVTFGDLKGTLQVFVDKIFAPGTKIRLRPSFFPFTEPSAEVDICCFACGGSGSVVDKHSGERVACRTCKATGWIEIMGAGMVDPEVFKAVRLDPDKVTGFAFGIGVERVAMLRYGVSDIRTFFENDVRFLRQFF